MPVALSQRDAFSYDKFTLSASQATDSPANRTFTLTKAIFLPELPETLEVLIGGVKLKGDGTATAAGSGDEFYVNSSTAPTTMTIETNAVLAAQTDSAVTTLSTSDILVVRRISNRTTKNIDYAPGSVIREADLDNSNTQIIHIAQEAVDIALQGIILDTDNKFDANDGTADRKIKNLEDGIEDDEAVNKGQLAATEVTTGALRDDAIDAKDTATDYATRVDAVVRHFSAASGGVSGAGVDQAGVFSAKEFAIGTTASTGGSAKDYATYTSGGVRGETGDHSSKAWAVGGTGVTGVSLKGASKDWAVGGGGTMATTADGAEFSAKEYSQGVTATGGTSKQWSLGGGSHVIGTAVAGTNYSAKAYAQLEAAGTDTYDGSAKGWAQTAVDTAVPGAGSSDRSALHYSTLSANSATAAKNSAAAIANSFDSFNDTYLGTMSDAVAFTADASTEFLTSNAHGLVDTQQIQVVGSDLPSGLSASTNYYVREKTTNTFKLEASVGGGAINLADNGSGSTWIYGDFTTPTSSTWAINSSTITVASNVGIRVGQVVTGTGIPSTSATGLYPNVLSIDGTSIVISDNMVAASVDAGSGGAAVTFANKGVYGTFNTTKDGPSTDNDGGALVNGMLYFNTTDNEMKIYKEVGAEWIAATSSGTTSLVMHKFTASGTETEVLAASFSPLLSYTPANIVVFLNGVRLDATDYTADNGNDIEDLVALAASDEVVVMAFKSFEVADTVSAASGGTFSGAVTFGAGLVANTADINAGTFDGIVGGTTPAAGTFTTCDATTDFTIGGTVITNNTITDDGTLTITATTGITLGQDTALAAGKSLETSTTGKVKQKGAFMQSSTHQALTLGY